MLNENWARWIYASVIVHFEEAEYFVEWNEYLKDKATYDEQGIIPVYIDGLGFNSQDVSDYIEVRMNGPHFTEISKNNYRGQVEVNVLLSITKDSNFHKLYTLAGKVQNTFSTIAVFRYGCEDVDNQTQVGCMHVNRKVPIDTTFFGQPDASVMQTQETIESQYIIELRGE